MATSGTFAFAPSAADLTLNVFNRIGIRPTAITQDQMVSLRQEANLMQSEWSNKGVTLWTVDLVTVPLVQGTATYDVDPSTIMILDVYVSIGSPAVDRYITPFSRSDYAAIANKTQQGYPTTYWYDRLINPTITMWQVPDGNGPYTLKYYRYRQIQDAEYTSGLQPEVPYRFLDAWTAGLSHRMARMYAPSLETARKADAMDAWRIAATQDVENAPLEISPGLSGYFR
jgi:hypothetical protein